MNSPGHFSIQHLLFARSNVTELTLRDSLSRLVAVGLLSSSIVDAVFRVTDEDVGVLGKLLARITTLYSYDTMLHSYYTLLPVMALWTALQIVAEGVDEAETALRFMETLQHAKGEAVLPALPSLRALGQTLSSKERSSLAACRWPLPFATALGLPLRKSVLHALLAAVDEAGKHEVGLLDFDAGLLHPDFIDAAAPLRFDKEVSGFDVLSAAARSGSPLSSFEPVLQALNKGGVPAGDALDFLRAQNGDPAR